MLIVKYFGEKVYLSFEAVPRHLGALSVDDWRETARLSFIVGLIL